MVKGLNILKNIVWGIVLIEFIIIIHILSNKVIDLNNKIDKIQTQINNIEKGN